MKQIHTNEALYYINTGFLKVSYLASLSEALVFSISITTLPVGSVVPVIGELQTSILSWKPVYTKLKK